MEKTQYFFMLRKKNVMESEILAMRQGPHPLPIHLGMMAVNGLPEAQAVAVMRGIKGLSGAFFVARALFD